MKAILALELRDDASRQYMKLARYICNEILPGLDKIVIGNMPNDAWCAGIAGLDTKYKYARRFLPFRKDYSQSNSMGSRGVRAIYTLSENKIYEAKEHKNRYFCMIKDWEVIRISELEVLEWLNEKR